MNYEEAESAIQTRFNLNFDAVPKRFENTVWKESPTEWVEFFILNGNSDIASIGSPGCTKYRHVGVVAIHIYVPKSTGTKRRNALTDQVSAVFRGQTVDGIIFRAPNVIPSASPVSDHVRIIVNIPFQWDETF